MARFGIILINQRTTGHPSLQHLPHLRSLSKIIVLAAEVLNVLHEDVACELHVVVSDDPV